MPLKGVLQGSPGYMGAQGENGASKTGKSKVKMEHLGTDLRPSLGPGDGVRTQVKLRWRSDGEDGSNDEKPEIKDPEAKPEAARMCVVC